MKKFYLTLKEVSNSSPVELAEFIHKISKSRLLSHTKEACEKYVHQFEKLHHDKTLNDLQKQLENTNDSDEEKEIVQQIERFKEEFKIHSLHINITYSNKNKTARTVKKKQWILYCGTNT